MKDFIITLIINHNAESQSNITKRVKAPSHAYALAWFTEHDSIISFRKENIGNYLFIISELETLEIIS